MESIENRTFGEIKPGDSASLVRTLTCKDIELFAVMSGDINPSHLDDTFASSDSFHKVVAHGMWSGALISTLLGTQLPGPGTVYVDQSLHFQGGIGLADQITVTVKVRSKIEETHRNVCADHFSPNSVFSPLFNFGSVRWPLAASTDGNTHGQSAPNSLMVSLQALRFFRRSIRNLLKGNVNSSVLVIGYLTVPLLRSICSHRIVEVSPERHPVNASQI